MKMEWSMLVLDGRTGIKLYARLLLLLLGNHEVLLLVRRNGGFFVLQDELPHRHFTISLLLNSHLCHKVLVGRYDCGIWLWTVMKIVAFCLSEWWYVEV
jgi:hypothetical protein